MSDFSRRKRKGMDDVQRRKRKILTILIAYLSVLLCCTFYSQKEMNRLLIHVREGHLRQGEVNGVLDDRTLPLSAVYRDENGPCVYEIIVRETPLGRRNYVNRISVYVKDTDMEEERVAVELSLDEMSRIVVWSSEEPQDRMIVWVEEE